MIGWSDLACPGDWSVFDLELCELCVIAAIELQKPSGVL